MVATGAVKAASLWLINYETQERMLRPRSARGNHANRERIAIQRRAQNYNHNPKFKAWRRKWHLERKFGLTLGEYETLLAEQGGGCAICGREPKPSRSLPIDHCHKTNVIRGILCDPCNRGLEAFGDSPERLHRAAAYLIQDRQGAKKVA